MFGMLCLPIIVIMLSVGSFLLYRTYTSYKANKLDVITRLLCWFGAGLMALSFLCMANVIEHCNKIIALTNNSSFELTKKNIDNAIEGKKQNLKDLFNELTEADKRHITISSIKLEGGIQIRSFVANGVNYGGSGEISNANNTRLANIIEKQNKIISDINKLIDQRLQAEQDFLTRMKEITILQLSMFDGYFVKMAKKYADDMLKNNTNNMVTYSLGIERN